MDHSLLAIVNALSELEEAYRKSDEDVKRVAEHRWDILQDPRIMPIIQRRINDAKSDGEVMECMRMQRFLQNAKQHDIPWALAEEQHLYEALADATSALWSATPETIRQVLLTHQQLLLNTYGIYFTKWGERRHSRNDEVEEPIEFVRKARKERRLIAIQFLEDAYNRDIDFAEKRFKKNFKAWADKLRDELRRHGYSDNVDF